MPLMQSPSKKAFKKNVETEMDANPSPADRKQNLAIAYSVQRKNKRKKMADGGDVGTQSSPKGPEQPVSGAGMDQESDHPTLDKGAKSIKDAFNAKGGKVKRYAEGGEIRAASSRPSADDEDEREMHMERGARPSKEQELDARDERHYSIDDLDDEREMDMLHAHSEHHDPRPRLSEGGEINFHDERRTSIDDAESERDMNMLDEKPMRHEDELRAAASRPSADDEDSMEMDMLHTENEPDEYSKDGIIRYAKGGKVDRDSRFADGGDPDDLDDSQADVQYNNGDEWLNHEDQMSYDAARKKTYFDDSQLSKQPLDSNEHGHYIDEDEHDMVDAIRAKMRMRRSR